MKTRMIEFDDDIVIVYDAKGKIIYKGMEDYEPMNNEPWKWNEEKGYYTLDGMIKKCIA